jgi:hypothetical protein
MSRTCGPQDIISLVILRLGDNNHHKIAEKVELHMKDVHANYDGIISKARVIKDQTKRMECTIILENNMDDMVCRIRKTIQYETISTHSLPIKFSKKRRISNSSFPRKKME